MNTTKASPLPLHTTETYKSFRDLGRLVADLAAGMNRAVDRRAKKLGITGPQWVVLMRISNSLEKTAAGLCRALNYDSGSMTRMLDRLVGMGLIERIRSKEDRRLIQLELTEEGKKLSHSLPLIAIEALNLYTKGFTPEEMKQLTDFLQRLIDNGASE